MNIDTERRLYRFTETAFLTVDVLFIERAFEFADACGYCEVKLLDSSFTCFKCVVRQRCEALSDTRTYSSKDLSLLRLVSTMLFLSQHGRRIRYPIHGGDEWLRVGSTLRRLHPIW